MLWIAVPTAAELLPWMRYTTIAYQRTDKFEEFDTTLRDYLKECDQSLKQIADVTLYCSHTLLEEEASSCKSAAFVDHGVDYQRFFDAGTLAPQNQPEDMKDIPFPRVGFIGGVDDHTFDTGFFGAVVASLPEVSFVLVGKVTIEADWLAAPNVYILGRKPYQVVADYMANCDVLVMPWRDNEWVRGCNPVKLKEYLAVGRPVVSTYFPEIDYYREYVNVESDPTGFSAAIQRVIGAKEEEAPMRDHTWGGKFEQVWRMIGAAEEVKSDY